MFGNSLNLQYLCGSFWRNYPVWCYKSPLICVSDIAKIGRRFVISKHLWEKFPINLEIFPSEFVWN